ncbi:MAG: DUF3823 domain-containing protein [Flavisolibacter sp.]
MNFKNIHISLALVFMILTTLFSACIKADNYDAPGETIRGTIYDSVTGQPLQLDNNEGRIELLEKSWTATTPTLNPFFYANDTGYYNNSRIFKGYYNVNVNGPFVPLNHKSWPSPNTDTTNLSPDVTIQGVVTQDITVAPILEIQWVELPTFNASDSSISATIIVNRGTNNPLYQKPIKAVNFYACEVPYPGDGNYDNRYSSVKTSFPANATIVINGVSKPNVFAFGKPYIVKTSGKITPRTWWLRVGANTSVSLPTGTPYNYSTIQSVVIK